MKKKEETKEEEGPQMFDSEIKRRAEEIIDEFKKRDKAIKDAFKKIRRNPF